MIAPTLTVADLRVLTAVFRDAHRYGRLGDLPFARALTVLEVAERRLDQQQLGRRAA